MNYQIYTEFLLGSIPDHYKLEKYENKFLKKYLRLSFTNKDKFYVSLNFEAEKNTIEITFMTDPKNKEFKQEYKFLENINRYNKKELQTKLKDIICSEMKTFINNQ